MSFIKIFKVTGVRSSKPTKPLSSADALGDASVLASGLATVSFPPLPPQPVNMLPNKLIAANKHTNFLFFIFSSPQNKIYLI